jgi:peptide/nickel transport system substrate-binding protein
MSGFRRPLAIAASVITAAALLVGCGPSSGSNGDATLLTVASTYDVTTWDPVKSFSTETAFMGNLYEPLLWKNPAGSAKEYTPAIATSYRKSKDAKTWTFTIRHGVKFHDGTPVDANAVKQSIEASQEYGGASFIWAPLKSIEAPNSSTVVMHLKYAAPMDLVVSSTYGAWIVSPKALAAAKTDKTYWDKGVDAGTGPYTLKDYSAGKEVVLKKFGGYWNKSNAATYGNVDIQINPDATTAQEMLTSGSADFANTLPLQNIKDFAHNPKYKVTVSPSPFNYLAYFNTQRKPFDDVRVRRALSYAVPYQDLLDVGGAGYGTQAHGPVPKGVYPYDSKVPQYHYDLAKAKRLLAAAGHPGGGFDVKFTYTAEAASEARFVPLIKDSFAKIGVNVEVSPKHWPQAWEVAKGDPARRQDLLMMHYWPTYSDAGSDNLYSLFHSSKTPAWNLSYWKNPQYDRLIDKAATLTGSNRAAAQALYTKAMKLLVDQAPGLFFYDEANVTVVPTKITGYRFNVNYPFTTFFNQLKPAS